MRWRQARRSQNVEDRRGRRPVGRPLAIGGGGALLIMLAAIIFGADPTELLQMLGEGAGSAGAPPQTRGAPPRGDESSDFVAAVLGDTEDTWNRLFADELGRRYQAPTLVLFTDAVQSACGLNSAAVGPFYCPADRKVYIDLGFYRDLHQRFGAPGDFAQAYVIAHEVGHHVQNLLGISTEVHRMRSSLPRGEANALSVRMELQADCLAGVWGHHAATQRQLLEDGDVEEGLRAAAAIGDDRMQQRAQGRVSPESWTHGSSDQRVSWFRRGLSSGRIGDCDTFAGSI